MCTPSALRAGAAFAQLEKRSSRCSLQPLLLTTVAEGGLRPAVCSACTCRCNLSARHVTRPRKRTVRLVRAAVQGLRGQWEENVMD